MKVDNRVLKKVASLLIDIPTSAEVDISIKDERESPDVICDTIVVVATYKEKPASYDDNQSIYDVSVCIELFGDSENRAPRITTTRSRDLEK